MKKVLVTAGPVYGKLDDNKIVSNRIRGVWAVKFADFLSRVGYEVILLVADTFSIPENLDNRITTLRHDGYTKYSETCLRLATEVDAAIMAAAVVNWIPEEPITGKMPTKGYKEEDIIQVPFILAPRVINKMKKIAREKGRDLTLIGCKMSISPDKYNMTEAVQEELRGLAYSVIEESKCNCVVANDFNFLKTKYLVYPDGATFKFENNFEDMYKELELLLRDRYYHTDTNYVVCPGLDLKYLELFDYLADRYIKEFPVKIGDKTKYFGSIAIKLPNGYLVSPREKGELFSNQDAVYVDKVNNCRLKVKALGKASLNTPLLINALEAWGSRSVVHVHAFDLELPTLPYAPPGTQRDSSRYPFSDYQKGFNIEGHGLVKPY